MSEVLFPALDTSTASKEGVLATWYVQDGEPVTAGQLLAEIQVDKVDAEVKAPSDGTVRLLVAEDATVQQGEPIARIE